jgi:hypothetical protein
MRIILQPLHCQWTSLEVLGIMLLVQKLCSNTDVICKVSHSFITYNLNDIYESFKMYSIFLEFCSLNKRESH